jgi:hypothetical protein
MPIGGLPSAARMVHNAYWPVCLGGASDCIMPIGGLPSAASMVHTGLVGGLPGWCCWYDARQRMAINNNY